MTSRVLSMILGLALVSASAHAEKKATTAARNAQADKVQKAFDKIGGMGKQIRHAKDRIVFPMLNPDFSNKLAAPKGPPRGVIIQGPPGGGKLTLARAIAKAAEVDDDHLIEMEGAETNAAGLEKAFKQAVTKASAKQRAGIIIHNFEQVAGSNCTEKGCLALTETLNQLMGTLPKDGSVVVIGTTSSPRQVAASVRRPGRFTEEIALKSPTEAELEDIITKKIPEPIRKNINVKKIARQLRGYMGADVENVIHEAVAQAAKRENLGVDLDQLEVTPEILKQIQFEQKDFDQAARSVQPAALKESQVEIPNVKFQDIGGQDEAVTKVEENVMMFVRNPKAALDRGVEAPPLTVLWGPPGNGKTLIAKAIATESGRPFISVKASDINDKYVGESERKLQTIFQRAREHGAIVFFDEGDSLFERRGSRPGDPVHNTLVNIALAGINGVEAQDPDHPVHYVIATNAPEVLDEALIDRAGTGVIEVPRLNAKGRERAFEIHASKLKNLAPEVKKSFQELAVATKDMSGRRIQAITNRAGVLSMARGEKEVTMKHFLEAIKEAQAGRSMQQQDTSDEPARGIRRGEE